MAEKYQFDANAQALHKIDMRPDADELVTPGWGDYLQAGWGKLNNQSSTMRGDKALLAPRRPTAAVSAKPLTTRSAQFGAKPLRRQVESLYARSQGGINFYAPPPKDDDFPDLSDSLILNQLNKSKAKPASDRKTSGFTQAVGLDGSLILGQLDKSKTPFKSNPLGFDDLLRETQGFSSTAVDGQALKEALKDESTPRSKDRPQKLKHMPPPSEAMATLAIGTKRKVKRSSSDEDLGESATKDKHAGANKRCRYNYVQVNSSDIPMDGNTQKFHESTGGRSPKQYLYGTSKVRRGIRTAASSATSVLRSPFIWWKKATEPRKTIAVANFDIPQDTVSFSDYRDTFIVGNLPDTDMDGV
jgi:hypothetical protein